MQPAMSVSPQAFAVKLDPAGVVVYSTYIGGSAETWGYAITVDSSGHAFITGGGVIPTTPGAIASLNEPVYVIELDAMGSKALVAIQGFGGNAIAVDMQGYLYTAGAWSDRTDHPASLAQLPV